MERTFYVFGSCVSRDGFEYCNKNNLIPYGYTARYSASRIAFPAIDKNFDLSLLTSQFQRKIVKRELENNLFADMEGHPSDFVVIDFIDDRFGLVEIEEDIYVTNSFELRNSQLVNTDSKKIPAQSELFFELWSKGIDLFLKEMDSKNLLNKIIVNAVFWASKFEDGTSITGYPDKRVETSEYIKGFNFLLEKQYEYLRSKLCPEQFIYYPEHLLTASLEHKWGRSPFHYSEEFYHFFLKKIDDYSFSVVKEDGFKRWQKKAYLNISENELFRLIPNNKSALYSVNYDNNQVPLDLMFRGFSEENVEKYKKVVVSLNGAITNRAKKNIPFFSLMDLSSEINVDCPFISISDPSLYLSKNLSLAWYNGNYLFTDLIETIGRLLDRLLDVYPSKEYKIVLCGGSGGGYAILNILNHISCPDKFSALIWNPQVSLSEYNLDAFRMYLNYAYPNLEPHSYKTKSELKNLMVSNNIIEEVGSDINSKIIILMNCDDHKHIFKHLSTLLNRVENNGLISYGHNFLSIGNNIKIVFGNWGVGHFVPSREDLKYFMSLLIKNGFDDLDAGKVQNVPLPNKKILLKQDLVKQSDDFWLSMLSLTLSKDKLSVLIDFPINEYYSVYNLVYYLVYKGKAIKSLWDTKSTQLQFSIDGYPVQDLRVRIYIRDVIGNQKIISKEVVVH